MENNKDLKKFTGEWVVLFGDKIVDHSYNLEEILKIADTYPNDKIIIEKIPSKPSSPNLSNRI